MNKLTKIKSKLSKIRKNNFLCIYHNNESLNLFKKYFPLILFNNIEIYVLYFGGLYNPPFFETIIFTSSNKNKNYYQMCWNMVIEDGNLIIPKSEIKHLYNTPGTRNIKPFHDTNYVIIHKTSAKIYIFYDKYRVIDFIITGYKSNIIKKLSNNSDIDIKYSNSDLLSRNWTKSLDWYKQHFDYKKKMVGNYEKNIIYLPYLHQMLQKMNSCIKIIIILKNPINRAYEEWYNQKKFANKTFVNETFDKAIENELKFHLDEPINERVSNYHYLQKGLYYKQIIILMRYFPKQNIYIFVEDIFPHNKDELSKIYNFLQIHSGKNNIKNNKNNNNKNIEYNISLKTYKVIKKFFKDDIKNLEKEILGYKTNWLNEIT